MKYLLAFIDIILPPRCILTGEKVDSQGTVSPKAWSELAFITRPYCDACGFPFDFDMANGQEALCAACLRERPAFEAARAALVYNDTSRDFILGFKHGDQTHAVVTMVPWLKMAAADFVDKVDVFIPVPLHRWRLLRRRYNQAALMAQSVAKAVGKRTILNGLIRTRATQSQGHMSAKDRAVNVKKAFVTNPSRLSDISGKSIALIDDVYTTGSTVQECTKALLDAGAAKVYVLSLARVVRPERVS